MLCVKCKKDIPDGAPFCCWCGKRQAGIQKPTAHAALLPSYVRNPCHRFGYAPRCAKRLEIVDFTRFQGVFYKTGFCKKSRKIACVFVLIT